MSLRDQSYTVRVLLAGFGLYAASAWTALVIRRFRPGPWRLLAALPVFFLHITVPFLFSHQTELLTLAGTSYLSFRLPLTKVLALALGRGPLAAPGLGVLQCMSLMSCPILPSSALAPGSIRGVVPATAPASAKPVVNAMLATWAAFGTVCAALALWPCTLLQHAAMFAAMITLLSTMMDLIGLSCKQLTRCELAPHFDAPFAALTLGDFWRRWNIVQSHMLKVIVYDVIVEGRWIQDPRDHRMDPLGPLDPAASLLPPGSSALRFSLDVAAITDQAGEKIAHGLHALRSALHQAHPAFGATAINFGGAGGNQLTGSAATASSGDDSAHARLGSCTGSSQLEKAVPGSELRRRRPAAPVASVQVQSLDGGSAQMQAGDFQEAMLGPKSHSTCGSPSPSPFAALGAQSPHGAAPPLTPFRTPGQSVNAERAAFGNAVQDAEEKVVTAGADADGLACVVRAPSAAAQGGTVRSKEAAAVVQDQDNDNSSSSDSSLSSLSLGPPALGVSGRCHVHDTAQTKMEAESPGRSPGLTPYTAPRVPTSSSAVLPTVTATEEAVGGLRQPTTVVSNLADCATPAATKELLDYSEGHAHALACQQPLMHEQQVKTVEGKQCQQVDRRVSFQLERNTSLGPRPMQPTLYRSRPTPLRRLVALLATFVWSGIEHEVFHWYLQRFITGKWLIFFTAHGVLVALEQVIRRFARRRWPSRFPSAGVPLLPSPLSWLLTFTLLEYTASWWFFGVMTEPQLLANAARSLRGSW